MPLGGNPFRGNSDAKLSFVLAQLAINVLTECGPRGSIIRGMTRQQVERYLWENVTI